MVFASCADEGVPNPNAPFGDRSGNGQSLVSAKIELQKQEARQIAVKEK
jgi:hypothetical protein